jgi:hypothetical protein
MADENINLKNVPMNTSELIQKKLSTLLTSEREELKRFVNANYLQLKLQANCELDCHACNVARIIECFYIDNKERFANKISAPIIEEIAECKKPIILSRDEHLNLIIDQIKIREAELDNIDAIISYYKYL